MKYSMQGRSNKIKKSLLICVSSLAIMASTSMADDSSDFADESRHAFNIASQNLDGSLMDLARQSGVQLMFEGGVTSSKKYVEALRGDMDIGEALSLILSNTNLSYWRKNSGVYVISERAGFQKIGLASNDEYEAGLGVYVEDDNVDDEAVYLDEVIVTASRRSQKLQDVAMSIASVNPDDFVVKGLTSLEDIIDYTPGVNFNTGGAAGQGNITFRGVSQEGSIPVTAIYVDDMPLTSSSPFAFGNALILDGLLGDLERVELVKGPQGTLYGAGAMGGVIRYISKDPALEEMRGSFSADISSIKEGGISQLYRGMVSAPLVKDKIGITLSGFYNDEAGFIDRLDPATLEVIDDDYNVAEIYGFSANVLVKLSEAASLKFSGLYQNTTISGNSLLNFIPVNPTDPIDPANPVLKPSNGKYGFASNDPGTIGLEYQNAAMTFKYDFDWAEFTSVTGYAKYSNPTNIDQVAEAGELIDFIFGLPPGTTTAIPTIFNVESEKFLQELRLASPNNDTFEWQIGLFYANEDTKNSQDIKAQPGDINLIDVSFPSKYEEKAAFANATYYVTPDFDVTAGIRYSDNSLAATFDFTGLLVGALDAETFVSDKVTTYLFNARWRVGDNLSLYARAASGFRPAYSNIPILDINTGLAAASVVDSDSLWSYEVGAKGSAMDGKFTFDVAYWIIDWSDFQAKVTINGLGTGGNSDAGVSSNGFEGTFNAQLTDQLRVLATVAYTKSTLDGDSLKIGALKGEKTRNLPDWTASFRADYDYTIGDIDAALGFGLRYVGNYNTGYLGGFSDEFGQNVGFNIAQFPIEDYVLADINASFTSGRFTLNLYATNLFNNYAFDAGTASMLGSQISAQGSIVKPRTIGASVSVNF
ncbi:MAG: hypothetical protein COB36_15040 [Alphaproteobacteria bacterium]|nr:MAG: hypothetical protein COB36_15040 [Alphaproteobacteria bacterium]